MMGEVFRQMTATLAVVNLVLAMLLIEAGDPWLFLCLACAVTGWAASRDRDAWVAS